MFKLVAFTALLAFAAAAPAPGYLGAPLAAPYSPYAASYAAPWGHGIVSAPVLHAPVVKAAVPVATSYANTVRFASPAVVAAPAPYVAHAPLVAAHAPLVASPYAHAW